MLNYGKHWLDNDDIAAMAAVLKSDFLTQGPQVGLFEQAIAAYVGCQYAVAVSSGTAALHIAVAALKQERLPTGSMPPFSGITAPNTFVASANCLCYNGLEPDFADIDPLNYSIDPLAIKKRLTPRTRIIIPVHFAGQACDMEAISRLKENPGAGFGPLYIIEDASHAIGSRYANGKPVGSCCYSDMTVFSFHPVKTIATGEGGLITTNDKDLYERLLLLRSHGITKDHAKLKYHHTSFAPLDPVFADDVAPAAPWYYEMQALGFNYRMTDIQAALGTSQMKKIAGFVTRRRQIVDMYNLAFKSLNGVTIPYEKPGLYSAFHLYVLKFDFAYLCKSRPQVMKELLQQGIGTQVHYIPVHLQPFYRENFSFTPGDFPHAEAYYQQCLSIPLYPKMTDAEVEQVITAIVALTEPKHGNK